jgi:hypothetical protein
MKYNDDSIAEKNTNNFAQKPANGGTPAIENKIKAVVIAKIGLVTTIEPKSVLYLGLDSPTTSVETTTFQILIEVII